MNQLAMTVVDLLFELNFVEEDYVVQLRQSCALCFVNRMSTAIRPGRW